MSWAHVWMRKGRLWGMVLLLPLLLFNGQAPTVTLTLPPTPAPGVIKMIAESTGRQLAVAPALSEEVILARLKDAPADKVLNSIARALLAKWVQRPDGITWLEPDLDAEMKLEKQEAAEGEAHLLNSYKYIQKRLGQQPEDMDQKAIDAYRAKKEAEDKRRKEAEAREDYNQMFMASSAEEESPAWRALARIVLQIDPKVLLEMPNDDREVWAENPSAMQHAFTDDAQTALKRYRQEFSILDPDQQVNRVKLIFKKWESGTAFNVKLEAIGPDGRVVDSGFARMNDDSDLMKLAANARRKVEPQPGEAAIVVPEEAREARMALSDNYKGADRYAIVNKWRRRLMDPVHVEPTQWHSGEDLVLAADQVGKQMVGTVNDLTGSYYWQITNVTPSQVITKHAPDFLSSEDGWLVVRDHERVSRLARAKAGNLIRDSVRLGGITVNAAAAWAGECPDRYPFINWMGDTLHVLLSGSGPYSALSTTIDTESLRLWASFGPGNIEALRNGGTLELARLPEAAKQQIAKVVYWFEGLDDNTADPTDRLPNGISDGTVTMTVAEKPVFFGWHSTDGPPSAPAPMDTKMFGTYLGKGNTWNEIPAGTYRQYDRFKLGVNRAYSLHFLINPGAAPMTIELSETMFDPDAQPVSELPKDLKTAAEKARLAALAEPVEQPKKVVIPPRRR